MNQLLEALEPEFQQAQQALQNAEAGAGAGVGAGREDDGVWDIPTGVARGTTLEVNAFGSVHDMLHAAIEGRGGRAALREIYQFCGRRGRIAYRRTGGSRLITLNGHWKSQVRHALYTSPRFCRCQDSADHWAISRSHAHVKAQTAKVRIVVGQETGGGRGPSSKSSRGAAKYHDDEDEDEEEYGLDDETGGLTEEDEEAAFKHRRSKSQGAEPSSRAPAAQAKPSRTSARAAVRAAGDVLRRIGAEEAAGAVGSIPRGTVARAGPPPSFPLGPPPLPPPPPPSFLLAPPPPFLMNGLAPPMPPPFLMNPGGVTTRGTGGGRSSHPSSYLANPETPEPHGRRARCSRRKPRSDCTPLLHSLTAPAPTGTGTPPAPTPAPLPPTLDDKTTALDQVGSDETALTALLGVSESTGPLSRGGPETTYFYPRVPSSAVRGCSRAFIPSSPLEGANYPASWVEPATGPRAPAPLPPASLPFLRASARALHPQLMDEGLDAVEEANVPPTTQPAAQTAAEQHPRLKRKLQQQKLDTAAAAGGGRKAAGTGAAGAAAQPPPPAPSALPPASPSPPLSAGLLLAAPGCAVGGPLAGAGGEDGAAFPLLHSLSFGVAPAPAPPAPSSAALAEALQHETGPFKKKYKAAVKAAAAAQSREREAPATSLSLSLERELPGSSFQPVAFQGGFRTPAVPTALIPAESHGERGWEEVEAEMDTFHIAKRPKFEEQEIDQGRRYNTRRASAAAEQALEQTAALEKERPGALATWLNASFCEGSVIGGPYSLSLAAASMAPPPQVNGRL